MTLRDEVRKALDLMGGVKELTVLVKRGAGPLGWDPVDGREAASAEVVVMEGPDAFGAVCRLGGRIRYIMGLNGDQPDSRMWPMGESATLKEALEIIVPEARVEHRPPPGK